MKILEVWAADEVPDGISDLGNECEVMATCYASAIGTVVHDESGEEGFVPFVAIVGDRTVPLLLCEDCHSYLQQAYQGA